MTKDEALRLALEALERIVATCLDPYSHEQVRSRPEHFINQSITAIKAALEAEDEPVAWLHRFIEGGISIGLKPLDLERHPERWEPLYTEPRPCLTCEALARTVMLDQTSHDTQRTWVGLTDEDEIDWEEGGNLKDLVKAIEAKLKEKNA
jgi:hypothetical protein